MPKSTPLLAAAPLMLLLAGSAVLAIDRYAAPNRMALQAGEIHAAAAAGDLVKLKALLASDPALVRSRDGKGMTPLHIASVEKRKDAVALLLAAGADVKAIDADKYTPLHRAAFVGDAESCRLLLEAGADPKAVETMGRTPLMLACGFGKDLETVKRLIAGGSDINYAVPGGDNVLLSSLFFGKPEIIDFLLQSGARLAEDGRSIWMAVLVSTRTGQEAVFEQAREAAKKKGMPLDRIVSLQDAASGGSVAIGEALLAAGYTVDQKNVYGWTALHAAADQGRTAFVQFLLARGAKIDDPDRMGRTAWHLARENKHTETADLLKARGAAQGKPKFPELRGLWLGQPEPGDTPAIFAPGIVSGYAYESEHSPVAFSPDLNEAYWTQKYRGPLMVSKRIGGLWTVPRPVSFMSPWGDGEPFLSPDGKRLYFLSFRPLMPGGRTDKENVWYVERRGGDWGEPKPESEAVNAFDHHWLFSVAADGTLYFSSSRDGGMGGGDIYVSKMAGGVHQAPQNAGPVINTAGDESMPSIAPDGSYMLFVSREPQGQFRMLISYRDGESWTKPVGLGEKIDSIQQGLCPLVTPDGKLMFFIGQGDIYWVRADFLKRGQVSTFNISPAN
ncbi:MAG: ankyrin repeat domain-containing protein [Candidatus Aminicenantes bacterium]|nr:ankyrin repeat domain-containing protein [Candidatus Aminicenantes bacterium]